MQPLVFNSSGTMILLLILQLYLLIFEMKNCIHTGKKMKTTYNPSTQRQPVLTMWQISSTNYSRWFSTLKFIVCVLLFFYLTSLQKDFLSHIIFWLRMINLIFFHHMISLGGIYSVSLVLLLGNLSWMPSFPHRI